MMKKCYRTCPHPGPQVILLCFTVQCKVFHFKGVPLIKFGMMILQLLGKVLNQFFVCVSFSLQLSQSCN